MTTAERPNITTLQCMDCAYFGPAEDWQGGMCPDCRASVEAATVITRKVKEAYSGGPAFPGHESPEGGSWFGMSLRDFYAGMALAGLTANRTVTDGEDGYWPLQTAAVAYGYADAMLKFEYNTSVRPLYHREDLEGEEDANIPTDT